ncbi:MAG: cardiolipin synthase [Hyphomicrobiales bacterium]|nr:cardiolipin synthase [Hyphomicrobiales bacterium]
MSAATIVALVHGVIALGLSLRVVMRNLAPGVSLAWLLLIVAFPFGGALIYLLVGERPLGRVRVARIRALRAPLRECFANMKQVAGVDPAVLRPAQERLATIAMRSGSAPLIRSGETRIIDGADAIIHAIIADLDRAQHTCDMAFYIWNEGGLADAAMATLMRAAARGVRCRLLLDAVGSADFLRSAQPQRLRAAGVAVVVALPVGVIRALFVRVDLRMHRKIVVIDDAIGYTGSMNMVDPRFFKQNAGVGEWVDAMLRFVGPPAAALKAVFLESWAAEAREPLSPDEIAIADIATPASTAAAPSCLIMPSGPENTVDSVRRLVVNALYAAQREVVITTPYFVPDEPLMAALESAALQGVAVTLILPARNDSHLVGFASRSYFEALLQAGARILQFEGGLLHTKSLTVDGETTIFGTFNLDIRSMRLNFEVAALMFDATTAGAVRALQARYETRAPALDLATWRQRNRRTRFLESAARIMSPLL